MTNLSHDACPRAEDCDPSLPATATIRMFLSWEYLSAAVSVSVRLCRVVCVPSGLISVKSKLRLTTAFGCFDAFVVSTNSIKDSRQLPQPVALPNQIGVWRLFLSPAIISRIPLPCWFPSFGWSRRLFSLVILPNAN